MSNPEIREFLGTKLIRAYDALGPIAVAGVTPDVPGKVICGQGQEFGTWVPQHQFEKVYQPAGAMSFGHALFALEAGRTVARAAWREGFLRMGAGVVTFSLPHDPAGTIIWRPSTEDMLAKDWRIVP